jgi:hypothetical protein
MGRVISAMRRLAWLQTALLVLVAAMLVWDLTLRWKAPQTVSAQEYKPYKIMVVSDGENGAAVLEKELNAGGWKLESVRFHPRGGQMLAVLTRR